MGVSRAGCPRSQADALVPRRMPSFPGGCLRSQGWGGGARAQEGRPLRKSLMCEEIEGAVYAFLGFFELQEVGCFGHEVGVQRHHVA